MIGRLTGTLFVVEDEDVILDVGGVGYQLRVTERVRRVAMGVPDGVENVTIFVETMSRDDTFVLYGFASYHERVLFRLVRSVHGVSGTLAMRVVSLLGEEALIDGVCRQDKSIFRRVHGIGDKVANRLCHELKGKVESLVGADVLASGVGRAWSSMEEDAFSALVHLGYRRDDARRAVEKVRGEETVSMMVKSALRVLDA
ncbi:MAG: Holliday junction branch migration protein RuvA [Alphaproteobacteria bacterium GM7ARS4]|nr:Holliday junction branch migration protein RuvA [Alphaproteobacteria bacterium GM7ARS4]